VLLVRFVWHHVETRLRRRLLRRAYSRLVVSVPRSARLAPPAIDLPAASELPAELREAAERLRLEADSILAHRVDYLGSGLVELGPEIDWQRDFKSGYRWPSSFYQDVIPTRLGDASDAKVPWELSRGHQLLTLARAARVFRDEQYACELENQLRSWLDANPPGIGINWVNTMEIAIRAVNWLWAIGTLEGFRPLDCELQERVTRSLQAHGRHIARNLEGSPQLRSNHFLADILGLLVLGSSLPGDRAAARWLNRAQRELERQIREQVLDDGVGFEASLSYHGLALEMFLIAAEVAGQQGRPFSQAFAERLSAMLDVSRAVRHSGGRVPLFGDGDSGRILPASFERPPTHDSILWLGAAIMGDTAPLAGTPDEEVAWTLGLDAWKRAADLRPPAERSTKAFPSGGLYVLHGGDIHAVVRCGGVGQNGNGGHAHCDLLSFELSIGGVPLVVDSGTYAYTFDADARNAFRSTSAHNTVAVDGLEQHEIDPSALFRMRARACPRVERWVVGERLVELMASHDGYLQPAGALHRRRFTLDRQTGKLKVEDELRGVGALAAQSILHLAPDTEILEVGPLELELRRGGVACRLSFAGIAGEPEVCTGAVSDRYGVLDEAHVLVARPAADMPCRFGLELVPLRSRIDAERPPLFGVAR
jgi:hypothetical protein